MMAAINGHLDTARVLVELGANVDQADKVSVVAFTCDAIAIIKIILDVPAMTCMRTDLHGVSTLPVLFVST